MCVCVCVCGGGGDSMHTHTCTFPLALVGVAVGGSLALPELSLNFLLDFSSAEVPLPLRLPGGEEATDSDAWY